MDGLKLCLQVALKKYNEENHTLPDRIFVFRDGVGDGQMSTVAEYEVPQISSCFSMFGENYQPKLDVVVVQKRISTRILGREPKGLDNPPPDTIIDHIHYTEGMVGLLPGQPVCPPGHGHPYTLPCGLRQLRA